MFFNALIIDWAERFIILLERYAHIVKGTIYGHVHQDYFTILRNKNKVPITIAYTCPSLTTYTYKNPGFRVYKMDPDTYKMLDYDQYYLDLGKSNKQRIPIWEKSYTFTEYYNVSSLSIRSHELLVNRITSVFNIIIL